MNRTLLSLGVTASILLSLLVFAQPSSAVLTTVSGPDEFTKPDPMGFHAAVEIRDGEQIPIEHFNLVIATDEGESVTVSFAANGTVLDVSPERGVVGEGEIRIELLRRGLEITPVANNAEFGYGYGYGTDERTSEREAFGYGYGYGDGGVQPSFAFEISMDSKAFKHGDYTLQLSVDTGEDDAAFASNEKAFEVLVPAGIQPGEDRPNAAEIRANGTADAGGDDDGEDGEARGPGGERGSDGRSHGNGPSADRESVTARR